MVSHCGRPMPCLDSSAKPKDRLRIAKLIKTRADIKARVLELHEEMNQGCDVRYRYRASVNSRRWSRRPVRSIRSRRLSPLGEAWPKLPSSKAASRNVLTSLHGRRRSGRAADEQSRLGRHLCHKDNSWTAQPGPQAAFVKSQVFEVVYGGARGGGKTDAALGDFALHAKTFGAAARGLLVRRSRVALEPTISRAQSDLRRVRGEDGKKPNRASRGRPARCCIFVISTGTPTPSSIRGTNYTRVYVEELTQFPRLAARSTS